MIRRCNISDILSGTEMRVQSVPIYCSSDTVTYSISDIGTYMKQYVPNMIHLRNRNTFLAVYIYAVLKL